jgi:hypothetical protein
MTSVLVEAGFGYPIGGPTLAWIGSIGLHGVRIDVPWGIPPAELERLLVEIVKANLDAVLIVGGWMVRYDDGVALSFRNGENPSPEALAQFARQVASAAIRLGLRCVIEIGNEPTITAVYKEDPSRYARAVRECSKAMWEVAPGLSVAAGSVHDLTPDSQEYLKDVINYGIPERTIVAVHPYRMGNRPWDGEADGTGIRAKVDWLRSIWSGEIAVSEMGWHTAERSEKAGLFGLCPRRVRWNDEQVAEFWRWELDFWRKAGARFVVVFQLNDGPNDEMEHRFGIRYFDGTPKPVAGVFKQAMAA